MKVNIEKPLHPVNMSKLAEFNIIVSMIINSQNESELRNYFEPLKFKHFNFGYGHNHMWIHEKNNQNRLLFVEF